MEKVNITLVNEAFIQIYCEKGIARELYEQFSFYVPGYQFMPKYRSKMWDGKVHLFNLNTHQIYRGLLPYVQKFCKDREYETKIDSELVNLEILSVYEAKKFIQTLELPHEVRDYQLSSFVHAIRNKRMLLLSPTGSGKSLVVYLILRWLQTNGFKKGLLIVPTINLVQQMFTDFQSYGYDSESNIHTIFQGKDKQSPKFMFLSTWQSVFKQPKEYFDQFDFVFSDECHLAKAVSLSTIISSCSKSKYRIGTTGSLDNTQTHRLVLEGLFGGVYKAAKTSDLIERGQLANFKIKCLILKHPKEVCKAAREWDYATEIDYIVQNPARNKFVRNLALSLEGNSLVLFQYVQKHGKGLYDSIKLQNQERPVFFVFGGTDVETREEVRALTEKENSAIIVASYGTWSQGANIRNLHNIIFASPSKSRIRNLQSIGRGLRVSDNKVDSVLYDIADDLRLGKNTNYTMKHFMIRLQLYDEEKFAYKFYNINIGLKNGNDSK